MFFSTYRTFSGNPAHSSILGLITDFNRCCLSNEYVGSIHILIQYLAKNICRRYQSNIPYQKSTTRTFDRYPSAVVLFANWRIIAERDGIHFRAMRRDAPRDYARGGDCG